MGKLLNDKRVLFSLTIQVFLDLASLARRPSLRGVSFFCTSKPVTRQAPACHGSLEWPSHSNLADAPSRAKWKELEFLEPYVRDRPSCFILECALGDVES